MVKNLKRKTIVYKTLGVVIFGVSVKILLDRGSDFSLLVGLILMLFGWVILTKPEKEADLVAKQILRKLRLN